METISWVWVVLQVILILVSGSIGAKIQVYKDKYYSRLLFELSPTDQCYNTSSGMWTAHYSTITDTCFVAYHDPNCKSNWSRKYMPGKTSHDGYIYIKSLQKCNDKEGGPQLNLDITTHIAWTNELVIPDVLESYSHVCSCVNVPQYVQNMSKWSIDNHHNGLFAYFESDCKVPDQYSKAMYIDAGHFFNSKDMHTHTRYSTRVGTYVKVQSLGPAPNTTYFKQSCFANDTIMNIELFKILNNCSPQVDSYPNASSIDLTTDENDDSINFLLRMTTKVSYYKIIEITYESCLISFPFLGYRFGSRANSNCYNIPKPVQRRMGNGVGSIQTQICVILYLEDDCEGRSVKILAPGNDNLTKLWESTVTGMRTLSLLYNQYSNFTWVAKSFHVCNKEKGGPCLNVDILSSDMSVEPIDGPVTLESYYSLCSCRNVPEYVQELDRWFIDNNGNSMMAYFTPDCIVSTFSPLWIPAGQSSYSIALGLLSKVDESTGLTHKIQSFGPDPNSDYYFKNCSKNCIELSSFGSGQVSQLNTGKICGFEVNSESTHVALLIMKRMQAHEKMLLDNNKEFQSLLEKSNQLGPTLKQVELQLENNKQEFNDKWAKLRDEIKELTDKLNESLNYEL